MPLYQLFYDGDEPHKLPNPPKRKTAREIDWGTSRREIQFWEKLRELLANMDESDRRLLLAVAPKMARR